MSMTQLGSGISTRVFTSRIVATRAAPRLAFVADRHAAYRAHFFRGFGLSSWSLFLSAKVNFFVMSKQSATFADKRITKSTWKSTLAFKLIIKTFVFGVATMFTRWFVALSFAISLDGDKKAFRNMTRPRCEWLRKVPQSVHHGVSPAPLDKVQKMEIKTAFSSAHTMDLVHFVPIRMKSNKW